MEKSKKPIIQHIQDFLDYCEVERGLSSKTQENYFRYLRKFQQWVDHKEMTSLLPHDLSPELVWDYRLFLSRFQSKQGAELSKKTQMYYLIALRALLGYFVAKDIVSLPPDKIKLPKDGSKEKTVKFLNLDQMKKLLEVADPESRTGLRDRTILESLFSTGLRVAELVALNKEQFDPIMRKSFVASSPHDLRDFEIGIIGKGKHPRTVYFSERALEWLKKYLKTREDTQKALFINYRGRTKDENRLTPRSIERIIKRYSIKAGVPLFTTPHTLRHCLHPSTRIVLADQIISARDLFFHHEKQAQTIDWQTLQLKNRRIQEKSYHITPLLSLWADGYNLLCSPNHRLFTIGKKGIEEIQAKDIQVDDYIMGIQNFSIKETPFIDPRLARLFGYICGDGTVSIRGRAVILFDKDKRILEFYRNIVHELFNINPSLQAYKDRKSWKLSIYII